MMTLVLFFFSPFGLQGGNMKPDAATLYINIYMERGEQTLVGAPVYISFK